MDFIPVPDAARRQYPHCTSKVWLPPGGDMTDSDIRSAETLEDPQMPGRRMFFVADDNDIRNLTTFNTTYFELAIIGQIMVPVSLVVWPDIEKGLRNG